MSYSTLGVAALFDRPLSIYCQLWQIHADLSINTVPSTEPDLLSPVNLKFFVNNIIDLRSTTHNFIDHKSTSHICHVTLCCPSFCQRLPSLFDPVSPNPHHHCLVRFPFKGSRSTTNTLQICRCPPLSYQASIISPISRPTFAHFSQHVARVDLTATVLLVNPPPCRCSTSSRPFVDDQIVPSTATTDQILLLISTWLLSLVPATPMLLGLFRAPKQWRREDNENKREWFCDPVQCFNSNQFDLIKSIQLVQFSWTSLVHFGAKSCIFKPVEPLFFVHGFQPLFSNLHLWIYVPISNWLFLGSV